MYLHWPLISANSLIQSKLGFRVVDRRLFSLELINLAGFPNAAPGRLPARPEPFSGFVQKAYNTGATEILRHQLSLEWSGSRPV